MLVLVLVLVLVLEKTVTEASPVIKPHSAGVLLGLEQGRERSEKQNMNRSLTGHEQALQPPSDAVSSHPFLCLLVSMSSSIAFRPTPDLLPGRLAGPRPR